ncbi:MAG: hypothetical protein HKUEN02_01680 [Anaerolineaceae bacterium]|nr:MAG: hypothetical protein HKUEN02_01680 [Anaerolineaceae bacterium]
MTSRTKKILGVALSALFILSACLPQGQPPAPTANATELANQVAEAVALTLAVAQAQTEAAQPAATNTTLPTQTEAVPPSPIPVIPSATPLILVQPTSTRVVSGGGGGGGGSVAPLPYDCTVFSNEPRDLTVFKKNKEFDIVWTIKNTGTKTIPANFDIKYFSGTKLMEDPNYTVREFGKDLKPGESIKIVIDAIAPVEKGKHIMTWIVEGQLCYPYVAIVVE